jgi:uncharacterized protein
MASKTALITGASGGIGLQLARVFARSEDRLNQLASELETKHGVETRVIGKDLTDVHAPQEIFDTLSADGVQIDALINNAGFAGFGHFATETKLEDELQMMQLNMITLTLLTKLFVKPMVERHSGKILNVASTASFQPGPLMAVYYATKAYVLSFSEAIARELQGTGVTVTALCPGPTESGFQKRAALEDSKLIANSTMPMMTSAAVAEQGYQALMAGKTVVIPGLMNRLGALLPRFVPRGVATNIIMNMQERVGH